MELLNRHGLYWFSHCICKTLGTTSEIPLYNSGRLGTQHGNKTFDVCNTKYIFIT